MNSKKPIEAEQAKEQGSNKATELDKDAPKARRRSLLKAISAAGVVGAAKLPKQWGRPVVDHVLLPAHAAGSPVDFLCALTCTVQRAFAVAITRSSDATTGGNTTYPISVSYFVTVGATCSRQTDGAVFGTNVSSQLFSSFVSTDAEHSFFMTYFPTSPTYSEIQPSGFDFSTVFSSGVTTGTQCEVDLSEFVSIGITAIPSSGPVSAP